MSSLTPIEKRQLEKLFDMGSGYVLDFSNRTFSEFIMDTVGKEIYDPTYSDGGDSKANRLRTFWRKEPDHVVAELLGGMLVYAKELGRDSAQIEDCGRIVDRLRISAPVQDLAALEPNAAGRDFETLAKAVKDCIQRNEPEAGLDRLHTFVVKYVRVLCAQHGIVTFDKPLHAIFGEYLKSLKARGLIESEMAARILKSTISILEAFNDVRNDRSLAHDNPLLSHREALLIFNNVATAIRFLSTIEGQRPEATTDDDFAAF